MRKTHLQTALLAIALLLIWWQASLWYQAQLIDDERTLVAGRLYPYGNSLAMAISERLQLLQGLDAFVQTEIRSQGSAFYEEFESFSTHIYTSTDGIRNLAIAPNGVFQYVYPPEYQEAMIGRSLFKDLSPLFRADLQRAIDTRQMALTNPHQMRRGGQGMVARKAVYENGTLWGIISMTIDIPPVLKAAGLNHTSGGLNMALRDRSGQVFYGNSSVFASGPEIYQVELPDSYWELAGVPRGGWINAVQEPLRIAQMAGLIIIGLLISLFYLAMSRQEFLSQMVMQRTSDLKKELAERKRAEIALQERELHLKAIFEAAKNVSFIIADAMNPQPLILEFSPGAENTFGHRRQDVLGKPVSLLLSPGDRDKLEEALRRMKEGTTLSGIITLLRRSQEEFPAMFSLYPLLDESGEIYGALGVCIDITEQKKMEKELVAARDAAEASARAKAEFTANVSHEMRTPLNAVIGMTDLLLESELEPIERDYVETIRSSGLSLLSIINEILDFSKMDASKMEMQVQPFDLQEVLEISLDQVSSWASEKHLELAYLLASDVPKKMLGDAQRLRQILVNLVSNAIKFTESGEVTIQVTAEKKAEKAEDEVEAYHFVVCDTGIGIPEDRMSRLFLPFSQVDTSLARRYDGTGLGLAISSKLANLMGGRIWAESKTGIGSQFHFVIPARRAWDSQLPGGETPAPDERTYSRLVGKKALISADKEAIRQMLANHMRSFAMTAVKAGSGGEAVRLLDEERYDVIVVDASISQWSALAERLSRADLKSLPVIEVVFLGQKTTPMQSKITAFLTKPIKEAQLGSALLRVFEDKDKEKPDQMETQNALLRRGYSNFRILLAEDNPVNQKVALAMLKHLGYKADVAANGRQVLSSLEEKTYDLILMDIQMPEMDGLEATRIIRSRMPASGQPSIIAMTAYTLQGDREQCLAAGMDEYISKPVKMEELKEAIERVVKPH
ncbi:MAG: response regulator [Methanothrix sp.]|nr:response regulator [Methanothrix sp.]